MPHQDMFRAAKPETAQVDWDPRLKPEIRYAPIGTDAIIEGDIVVGKLTEVRKRKIYSWSEEAKQLNPDDPNLGLTDGQKELLRELKQIQWPHSYAEAARKRARARALRLIADVVKFEEQGTSIPEYPTQAVDALKKEARGPAIAYSIIQVGMKYRWPNGVIPYTIDANAPNQSLIAQAIDHWHTRTDRIHLRPATSADPDSVRFVAGAGCSSSIGRVGGEQLITLADGCLLPQIIHEIGHAVGLWHEQSRNDRDYYITIHDENVDPDMLYNFDQAGTEGQGIGKFDFGSIMLYPPWAFSDNGKSTMVSRWPGIGTDWGVGSPNITDLSPGDLQGVAAMYLKPADPPNPQHPASTAVVAAAPIAPTPLSSIPNSRSQARVPPPARPPAARSR
jgi:hypothetical protein